MSREILCIKTFAIEYGREGNVTRHKKNLNVIVYSVSEVQLLVSVLPRKIWAESPGPCIVGWGCFSQIVFVFSPLKGTLI